MPVSPPSAARVILNEFSISLGPDRTVGLQLVDAATNAIIPRTTDSSTLGSHISINVAASSISRGFEIGRALVEINHRCGILVFRFSCDVQDQCESTPNYENLVEFLR